MSACSLLQYRNKVDVSIHYSWVSSPFMSLFRVVSLILIIIRYVTFLGQDLYSFIYLTFYGFVVTWIYFSCVVLDLIIGKLILRSKSKIEKLVGDCINILFEVTWEIQFTLTLLYWIVLYDSKVQNPFGFDNLGVHLMPLVLLFVDFFLNSYQFPIRHIIITYIVSGIYIVINQVHACTIAPVYGNVYPCGGILIPFVAFVMLAIFHGIGHLVWKFARSNKIKQQLKLNDSQTLLQSQIQT